MIKCEIIYHTTSSYLFYLTMIQNDKMRLTKAVLTNTHNLCFEQEYEKYQNFLSENYPFLVL